MADAIRVSGAVSGTDKSLSFETGKLAQQSMGAVLATMGGTTVLATANAAKDVKPGMDFFPLTIDVEERAYAAGKIPGSFFRREGRPTEDAILTCRLTDRPLRPAFPDGFRNETQVVLTILGADMANPHDVLAINAASASLMISGIPFDGPIGAVRVAHTQAGEWIPHPTYEEGAASTFELVVAGRVLDNGDVAIMMVEAGGTTDSFKYYADGAPKVDESALARGLDASKTWIKESIALQRQLVASVVATKGPIVPMAYSVTADYTPEVFAAVERICTEALKPAVAIAGKAERNAATDAAAADALAQLCGEGAEFAGQEKAVKEAVRSLTKKLVRKLPSSAFAPLSVDVVAAGRRNNPKEPGVPPLSVYNPLHYMELPELFMEFISSMTGKSPSTTGAGSEGALTKGPFNALAPIVDLNNNFLAYALTGYDGWLSSAGYIGPKVRVDHDISMLVPELFSRMWPDERRASNLIADGYLEKLEDFEFDGRKVLASRLGYRMNERFATTYFGRIFLHPDVVFTDDMLRPEQQDLATFAESMDVIVTTHQRVAQAYFNDGGVELAVPPLRGLLEIMAEGQTSEGWTLGSPEFREQFTRESVLASDWYAARLDVKQAADVAHQQLGLDRLREFSAAPENEQVSQRLHLQDRIADAETDLAALIEAGYRESLVGTIGRQEQFD